VIIRKSFTFEGAHVVRNCTSKRCSQSVHGHSFTVELFLEARYLDAGQMVYDFGILKNEVKSFIDAFDHTYVFWDTEDEEFKKFFKTHSARWISLPVSPSAESLALTFFIAIRSILLRTQKLNKEDPELHVRSVRVHETATGYAEAFKDDVDILIGDSSDARFYFLSKIEMSDAVRQEMSDSNMLANIISREANYIPAEPMRQIKL